MASIYRRENGTYCVRVYYGVHNGVQKVVSKTYTPPKGMTQKAIEKDLQRFAKRFEEMVHSGEFVPGAEIKMQDTRSAYMTVAQFIPFYYLPRAEERLSPNTMRFYRTIIDQFILPSYGELRLIDLRKEHLQQFIDYLAYNTEARADGKGGTLSAPTIKRYASVFRAVVTAAYDTGFLEDDPFAHGKVDYPKDKRPVRVGERYSKAYGMEEINVFLRALRKEKPLDRILLLTSVVIGARRAEVVALKWEDVDFERGCLYIDKSAYKVKGEKQALKAPKSEQGYRDVYFPDIYKNELLSWRDEQEKQRTAAGDGWQEQGFIFTNHKGDMVSLYSLTRLCEKFEKKNDIRHLKLHGLRHTFDSVLCSKGVGMETLKEIMGHKSISTTEIYTHALTEDKQNAAKVMNEVIAAFAEGEEEPDGTDDSPEDREEMAGA